jgi:hypothetical protein
MDVLDLVLIGSYSIVFAMVIAIVRIRIIHRSYYPFVLLIFFAGLNEFISFLLIRVFKESNAVSSNILGFVEALFWTWQFRCWTSKGREWKRYPAAAMILGVIWIVENVFFGRIFTFSSAYAIVYSFVLVFFAIDRVNHLIVEETRNLLVNSQFLICIGVVIFYSYRIFVESFYLFEFENSQVFLSHVFSILAFVNLFVNLLFALATLWIPSRQKFFLPYW